MISINKDGFKKNIKIGSLKITIKNLEYYKYLLFGNFIKKKNDKLISDKIEKISKAYKIISLGTFCLPRVIATFNGLKPRRLQGEKSCPFDLAFFNDIDKISELIDTNFKEFYDDLVYECPKDWNHATWVNYTYKAYLNHEDTLTRREVVERYNKRICNFYEYLNDNTKHKFFLIASLCEISKSQITNLKNILSKYMNKDEFDIIYINLSNKILEFNNVDTFVINISKRNFVKINKSGNWIVELKKRRLPEAQKIYEDITFKMIDIMSNVMN